MDQLYIRYFVRLAKFFQSMTLRADVVEELINDMMLEVWKAGESIRTNASVRLPVIMSTCCYAPCAQAPRCTTAILPRTRTESIEWFETWPPMSRCLPNSISCSEFPNHIRERAHRGC
jgi:hypothetical protein